MKKIGLIVNPIAGMGGSVGLKGTDGDIYLRALEMGAKPVTPKRINELLLNIKNKKDIFFIVAPGKMGKDYVKDKGFEYKVIGEIGEKSTAEDTKNIAELMMKDKIDLILFCGGDGTAIDIYDAIGLNIPVVAIPAGVKMFSSIFALNPRAAAEIIDKFLEEDLGTQEKEILDINEDSFRKGILDSKLYGYLKTPKVLNLIQASKDSSKVGKTAQENKYEIAQHIIENMKKDTLYLLGPGTTVKSITDELILSKTLLGIDALYNKEIIGEDLNEKGILKLIDKYPKVKIIVTPIGGQGFIFGRGNKQFTSDVLKKIGKKNIIIIATEEKVKSLKVLRIDSGDLEVDNLLKGFTKVLMGYKEELVIKIE
jgi:predicted polyphosphate/ATP-dependent NAD kinase